MGFVFGFWFVVRIETVCRHTMAPQGLAAVSLGLGPLAPALHQKTTRRFIGPAHRGWYLPSHDSRRRKCGLSMGARLGYAYSTHPRTTKTI